MGSSFSSCFFGCFGGFSSSSSASPPQIKYDVFLSCRGEDTRYNFITHLHKALDEKGINTFIDDNLNRGDDISPALLTTIEKSQIYIILFSKNYASSTRCLHELIKILECKKRETNQKIVIPVLYGVSPSDLRNQTGSFADAFSKHEKRFKENLEQVHRWKDALKEAANLSGWPSRSDKSEAELIEVIVEDVWQKLDYLSSSDTSNLVGIDSKIKEIESLLCMGTNDFRSVGIWGIGGIGKTTLAEAVFNKISHQFKGCSYFVRNVREHCGQSNGLNRLQQEFLLSLFGDKHADISVYAARCTSIKNIVGCKKLFIVFDDVSDFRQIECLIGSFDFLHPQSRIIVTTRDKQVLQICEVNQIYEVKELNKYEALKLFYMYAFRRSHPTEDHMKLSKRVVKYAGGIPLALRVLGSHLNKRRIEVWESVIRKLCRRPHLDIYHVLKRSYDELDVDEQMIFLDIACFFKSSSIEHVASALEACGFHAELGILVLLDKSLIAISHGTITMHDLLEEMAKEVVRRESIVDPAKRSRLWDHEEINYILTRNMGTATIEGIALDMSKIKDNIMLNPCDFTKMHRLRVLKLYNSSYEKMNTIHIFQGLKYTLPALRYLSWHTCLINSPLSSFSLENIVVLDMSESKVEQLWNGVLPLAKLKEVDLSCSYLTSCPDLSGSPNLKKLNLSRCRYLCEISPSVGYLNELDFLDLRFCTSLNSIPDFNGLISLRDLDLTGCPNLKMLHEMPCNLETLYLDDCSEVDQLPKDIGRLKSLKILSAERTLIRELPSSIIYLRKLKELRFSGLEVQDGLHWEPYSFTGTINWEVYLDLSNCMMVKCLPKLQVGGRRADNLTAVEVLSSLSFQDCTPLADFEDIVKNVVYALQQIEKVRILLFYPGSEVPKWFNFRSLGHFINVELSPNWLNQSFLGFVLCVVVAPRQDEQKNWDGFVKWTCKVISKDEQSFIMNGRFRGRSNHVYVKSHILPLSPHTLCDVKEISFEIEIEYFRQQYSKIEKCGPCGVHLMYS